MFKKLALATVILAASATLAEARDQIRIVGSSTVYPFVTVVSEQFSKKTKFKTPIVESTGTGGGFKLFCEKESENSPDISNASRRIKPEELVNCYKAGIQDISEVKIGYDGIVIANAVDAPKFTLSVKDIFLALARKVPSKADPKKLVDNYYKTWNQVNPDLPKQKIEVYGPPPTSGTRDSFAELALEGGCVHMEGFKAAYPDSDDLKKACHLIREDGAYIEAGENDNLIVQKLNTNKTALGIFGYSFLQENPTIVKAAQVSGTMPTHETIADASYILSRSLYVYVNQAHIGKVPGIKEFIAELVSTEAIGDMGYLDQRGLIPLPKTDLQQVQLDALSGKKLENLAEDEKTTLKK